MEEVKNVNQVAEESVKVGTSQFVTFYVGSELYTVNIDKAKEIVKIKVKQITPIPTAIDEVEGAINLRGNIVPVLSLHKALKVRGHSETIVKDLDHEVTVIILDLDEKGILGLEIDRVHKVISVSENEIFKSTEEDSFIAGKISMEIKPGEPPITVNILDIKALLDYLVTKPEAREKTTS